MYFCSTLHSKLGLIAFWLRRASTLKTVLHEAEAKTHEAEFSGLEAENRPRGLTSLPPSIRVPWTRRNQMLTLSNDGMRKKEVILKYIRVVPGNCYSNNYYVFWGIKFIIFISLDYACM